MALESIEDNPTSELAQGTLLDDDQSPRAMEEVGSEKSASRINRIRQLFNEALERVHTNDEDTEVSVEATLANTTDNKGE